jgi:hypothetical protein
LISYSLRGDALEWFKNNKASITSWKAFVTEIKRAFTSLYHEELAFKKLEAYSQGENQSIRNFYNDTLKLCKEADPAMSEATKLKNLLSKTKSSIQLEVRKKKPTSTAEFLDFAKEVEELLQLSNMSNETTSSGNKAQSFSSKPKSSFQSKTKPNFNRPWNRSSNNSFSRESGNDNRSQSNSSAHPNRNDSSFSKKNQNHQNQFKSNQYSSQNSGQRSTNATDNKNSQKDQTPRNNVSKSTHVPSKAVNAIDTSRQLSNTEETLETLSSAICSQCGQFGHETSVCPNF